jgi:hypothetical protein
MSDSDVTNESFVTRVGEYLVGMNYMTGDFKGRRKTVVTDFDTISVLRKLYPEESKNLMINCGHMENDVAHLATIYFYGPRWEMEWFGLDFEEEIDRMVVALQLEFGVLIMARNGSASPKYVSGQIE